MNKSVILKTFSAGIIAVLLFSCGLVLEMGYQTFWLNASGVYLSPVIWLAGGMLVCFSGLYISAFRDDIPLAGNHLWNKGLLLYLCFAITAIGIGFWLAEVFVAYPIAPENSDIVPSLQLYVRRWLAGETVYAPLIFPTWTVHPTYFPLLWMPYAFSEILQIDYRWTAYAVFLLALALWNWRLIRQEIPLPEAIVKTILPFGFLAAYLSSVKGVFGYGVELLPVGFYLILALSVFHKSNLFMAVGILLCLLSRYAFTFWLPVYLLILWMERGFKTVFQVGLYVLMGILLLYVLPFLADDPGIFTRGLAYYGKTAETQWVIQSWQREGEIPHHLGQGLSFAIYFYEYQAYELMERLLFNKKVHLLICSLAALSLLAGYFLLRKRGLNVKVYLVIGLKFYLILFYGFFYVPFSYLFMVPFLLVIPLLYMIPFTEIWRHSPRYKS